jgi:hypothetical protein
MIPAILKLSQFGSECSGFLTPTKVGAMFVAIALSIIATIDLGALLEWACFSLWM